MRVERELMRGAGPLAVLQLLSARERYGYELIEALAKETNGVLAMGQSTLYPLLYNLEAKKLIASRVDESSGRPRRYYRLTDKGRKRLARDLTQWQALLAAMQGLGLTPAPAGRRDMSESMPLPYGVRSKRSAEAIVAEMGLPRPIRVLILDVVRMTRLWKREKVQVADELVAHFRDGLLAGRTAEDLIETFGDPRLAAKLIRRAKKRNRPIWWRATWKTVRGVGLFVSLYVACALLMATRQPRVTVDYLAEYNKLLPSAPADQQAWPIYRAALLAPESETFIGDLAAPRMDDKGNLTGPAVCELTPHDAEWPKAVAALQKHPLLVQAAREGGRKPILGLAALPPGDYSAEDRAALGRHGGWIKRGASANPSPAGPLNVIRDNEFVQPFTWMALLLAMDSRLAATQGDAARVLENHRSTLGIARHAAERPTTYGLHNWTWCYTIANKTIAEVEQCNPRVLDGRRAQLLPVMADEAPRLEKFDLTGDRLYMLDVIQRCYTDNGRGDGSLTYRGIDTLLNHAWSAHSAWQPPWDERTAYIASLPAAAALGASRKQATQLANRLFDDGERDARLPLWQRLQTLSDSERLEQKMFGVVDRCRNMALAATYVSTPRATLQRDGCRAFHEASMAAVALDVWRERHGAYPASLVDLVPEFLPQLPIDHSTGQPLRYKLQDGRPLLYGLGRDGDDDGGAVGGDRNRWPIVPAIGDWVLYPPAWGCD